MNGYIAIYKGNRHEIYASSSYEAQQIAKKHFKAKKAYEITIVLCEVNGKSVEHGADI